MLFAVPFVQTASERLTRFRSGVRIAFKVEVAPQLRRPAVTAATRRNSSSNLFGNAIKFTDAGEVVIKAAREN
jgi:signal transduction histidine kinase